MYSTKSLVRRRWPRFMFVVLLALACLVINPKFEPELRLEQSEQEDQTD
jgi:hypothetical protein